MAKVTTHDFKRWAFIFGSAILTGFDEGGFTITFDNDLFSAQLGADGEHCRSLNNHGLMATVEVNLQQASGSNAAMQAAVILDQQTRAGAFALTIRRLDGGKEYFCQNAYISKQADEEVAAEAGVNTWSIICPELVPANSGYPDFQ